MIRYFIFSFFMIVTSFNLVGQEKNDILMTVGQTAVTVGEFQYIYEKNNGENANYSAKSIKDYLDLYTNFKLKVEKAKQMKLDTISELKSELAGYRKQLASSYLIDKEVSEALLKELYGRMQEDIEFSHIFSPAGPNDSPSVRDHAKAQMLAAKAQIVAGMDFDDAAKNFSADQNTSANGGKMGYFTAKLPAGFYELENALYSTKIGDISDVVETRIGYHIIKVTNKRKARGQINAAHILIKNDTKEAMVRIDSIHNALKNGADFNDLVYRLSQDKTSNKNYGLLPSFGINNYDIVFEDAAYNLKNDGDFSAPFQTKAGWHIIKRISKPEMDSYELFVRKMKAQINKDERFELAKLQLIKEIKQSSGFTENKELLKKFTASLNEEFYSYKWNPEIENINNTLFSYGGNMKFSLEDFAMFCKKNTRTRLKYDKNKPLAETVNELYTEFTNEKAIEFEEKTLDYKYPDFKALMREYEEGILLFEATKINVWDKANQDSSGLMKFYENNKVNYIGEEKAKIETYTLQTMDMKLAESVAKFAEKNSANKVESKFNKKQTLVSYTTNTFEKSHENMKGMEWRINKISKLSSNAQAKHISFIKITEILPATTKTLSEARGYVVADYQDFLEKKWIAQLKEEYPVMLNKVVLSQLEKM